MHIALASDHGGFQLKEVLKISLAEWGYQVSDLGAHHPDLEMTTPTSLSPSARH